MNDDLHEVRDEETTHDQRECLDVNSPKDSVDIKNDIQELND